MARQRLARHVEMAGDGWRWLEIAIKQNAGYDTIPTHTPW
jgi:hypothetical protein